MLAVMVVSPIRPSAYAIPGLSTPRAASRRTGGVQISGSRRTRATTRRKAQLTASCTGRRVRGATSSTTCLETTVPMPQQPAAAIRAATAVRAVRARPGEVWMCMEMLRSNSKRAGLNATRRDAAQRRSGARSVSSPPSPSQTSTRHGLAGLIWAGARLALIVDLRHTYIDARRYMWTSMMVPAGGRRCNAFRRLY
jgi:hypothetical protein